MITPSHQLKVWFDQHYYPEGRLTASTIQLFLESNRLSIEELMLALLPIAQTFAHPDISHFYVGAVVLGYSGAIYLGANQEYLQQPLDCTLHAEQVAVVQARNYQETGIEKIAILHSPCGFCRQFLLEANPAGDLVIKLVTGESLILSQLLPWSFSAEQLQIKPLFWQSSIVELAPEDKFSMDSVTSAALLAAKFSHAPYSQAYCGISVQLQNQSIISASYLENAAFNPSINPLSAVLSIMRMRLLSFSEIKRIDLVQCKEALIDQMPRVQSLLSTLNLNVNFTECKVRRIVNKA